MYCLIAKTKFKLDFVSPLMNKQIEKYQVSNIDRDYIHIESKIVREYDLPTVLPSIKSKYYNIYYEGDIIKQVQFNEDNSVYGVITYSDKHCLIEMDEGEVNRREYLLSEYALFYYVLKYQDAIMIHSSSIKYNDSGILFIAKSGTGKSTQAKLWKNYYDVIQINDDKNILILEDDNLMIYGNPYSGKSCIDENISTKLTHLVFIYQNKENVISSITKRQQMLLLMPQITNSSFMYNKEKWNRLTDKLLLGKGYLLGCTISKEAVDLLKSVL